MNQHDEQHSEQERREALPEHEYREQTRGPGDELGTERPPDMQPDDDEPRLDPADEAPVAYKPRSG